MSNWWDADELIAPAPAPAPAAQSDNWWSADELVATREDSPLLREYHRQRLVGARQEDAATATSSMPAIVREPFNAFAGGGASVMSTVTRPFSKEMGDYFAETGKQISARAESTRKDDWSPWLSRIYGGAVGSAVQSAIAAPAGPAGMYASFALTEGNDALYEAEQAGLKGNDRLKYAAVQGAIEGTIAAVFGKLGFGGQEKFISDAARGAMKATGKQFLKATAQEVPEELLTEAGHAIAEQVYGINPTAADVTSAGFWQRMGDTVAQTIMTMGLAHGAARLTQQRQTVEELKNASVKGFVSEVDGRKLGLTPEEMQSRKTRYDAVRRKEAEARQELERTEKEIQNAQEVQPEGNQVRPEPPAAEVAPEAEVQPVAEPTQEELPDAMARFEAEFDSVPAQPPAEATEAAPLAAEAVPEPVPLSPREQAQRKQSPAEPFRMPADEVPAAKEVAAIRKENKRRGKRDQPDAVSAPQPPTTPPEAAPKRSGLKDGVVQTIAGKMDLDEFEAKGYAPEQVTREDWVNLQRAARRKLGQSEESGTQYAPFGDYEQYHEQSVRDAVKRGEDVDEDVLKDYPDLKPPTTPQDASEAKQAPEVVPTPETLPEAVQELPGELGAVYQTSVRGRKRFAVRESLDNRGFGDSLFDTKEEAERQGELVRRRAAEREAAKKAADEKAELERQAKAEAEDLDGFASDVSPMQRGRIVKTLGRNVRFRGKATSKRDMIRTLVSEGRRLEGDRLLNEQDEFIQLDTKAERDYAQHLIGRRAGSEPAPDRTETDIISESRRKSLRTNETSPGETDTYRKPGSDTASETPQIAKPKRGRKAKASEPQTLAHAVQQLGGLSPKRVKAAGVNIYEDLKQAGVPLSVFKNQGGGFAIHGLDTMAVALESGGYWKAPEGANKADALLQALKDGAKTFSGMESGIEADYAAYQAKRAELEQEMADVEQAGSTRSEIEETLQAGTRDGLAEAEASEGEAGDFFGDDGEVDLSFNFGANAPAGIAGEQQALFQKESQGSLFNVSRSKGKAKPTAPQRSELEKIEDDLKAAHVESLPGQKTMLQQAADDALKDAQDESKRLRDMLGGDTLFSNPMLDPKIVAQSARVVYKYAKYGVRRFQVFMEKLTASIGQKHAQAMEPVMRAEWNKLQAAGEFPDMEPADLPAPEPSGNDLTSIKNEVVNDLREKRGVEALPEVPAQTRDEWMDAAAARIAASNGTIGPSLVAEINQNARNLSNIEVAILQIHYRAVNNAFDTAAQDLFAATESGDPVAAAVAQTHADNLLQELVTIEEATKAAGREWGRSGVARQIALNRDFSLGAMATRARVANAGKPLDAEQTAKVAEQAKTIASLQERLQAAEHAQAELDRQMRVEVEIRRLADEKPAKAPRAARKEKLQQRAADAVASFKEKWSTLFQTGIVSDPKADAEKWAQITTAAVEVVKAYTDLGVFAFGEFMVRVRKDLGVTTDQEEAFQAAWDQEKAAGNIPVPELDTAAVTRIAKRVARTAVEAGITEREAVVDLVHESLQEALPEITRREAMDALSGYGQFSPLSRDEVDRTLRDLNGQLRQLAKLEDLEAGRPPAKTGTERREPSDEERRLAQQVNEAMKRAGFQSRPSYAASLQKRIDDYRKRIADGDFVDRPKKEPRKLSRAELDLKRELQEAQQEFFESLAEYRLANLTGVERAIDYVRETAHVSRALMTSFDLSAVFRQGGAVVFAHPGMGLKAGKQMLAAMVSQQSEFDTAEEIRNRPNGQLYDTAGLSLTDTEGAITRQEEAFMGRWAKKIAPVRGSARAYTTFLNVLRADAFDSLVENLGRSGAVTLDEAKVIARFVNVATGRADLGKFNGAAANLNTVFFAPRYVASRFQYLATPFLLPGMKTSGRVKKAIAIEYARHATGVAMFMGAVVGLGALLTDDEDEEPTVELDPRSSDFLKIKIGETRIDPMSGLSQAIVFLARIGKGERKTASGEIRPIRGEGMKFGDQTTADVIGHFLWSKLAPIPGSAVNLLQGKNVVGEEVTPAGAAIDLIVPLSFREVQETMVARGIPQGTAISALALLGMGTATYGDRTQYLTGTETERQEQFDKFVKGINWDTPDPAFAEFLTVEQMDKVAERREERKQSLVVASTADPVRKNHKSDESFADSVAERDKAAETLRQETGWTKEEAIQLLRKHYADGGKITPDEKKSLSARIRKLNAIYGD